ncbi:MAG: hypothetical protein ONB44_05780 [candidate division KSB1 bacterium]|nr:hypothetical protein [candidate division KSB1 bacterium]MDZ7301636.1 hypothetical protein [candidate division KSB1 bacterium]MDZ7313503.1 hypothetical protein [candidate division KSB1 bacterium]
MLDPSTWELEAWKAQVGLLERFILIVFGALFLPVLSGKEVYSPIVLYVFGLILIGCVFVWVKLVREATFKKEKI